MNELIKIQDRNGIEVVDSRLIAASLEIEHRALLQTIAKHQGAIELNFGRVAFEMLPFDTAGGTQETKVAQLTEDQALFISTLSRNSATVVQFKATLVQSFQDARRNKQAPALSQLDILAQSVQILQQQQRELAEVKASQAEVKAVQAEHGESIRILEAKTTTRPEYFTVVGYAILNRMHVGIKIASSVGQRATRICKERGYPMDSCTDPRFGKVNMYPAQVLREVFNQPIV